MLKTLKKLQNKRGLTLIELLVGFAIFGFISIALVGFITVGSRSYRNISATINLQIESQVTMTFVSEYVIECNGGIAYDSAENTLYVVNRAENGGFITHVFSFEAGENSLYYSEEINGERHLISSNVSSFSADVSGSDGSLSISMGLTAPRSQQHRRYEASRIIKVRNPVLFKSDYTELMQDLGI